MYAEEFADPLCRGGARVHGGLDRADVSRAP